LPLGRVLRHFQHGSTLSFQMLFEHGICVCTIISSLSLSLFAHRPCPCHFRGEERRGEFSTVVSFRRGKHASLSRQLILFDTSPLPPPCLVKAKKGKKNEQTQGKIVPLSSSTCNLQCTPHSDHDRKHRNEIPKELLHGLVVKDAD